MAKRAKTEKPEKFETGQKFGRLMVICLATWHNEIICVCQCECLRIVRATNTELKAGKSECLECAGRRELYKFNIGDVVIFRDTVADIPFGSQMLVNNLIETDEIAVVEVEFQGKSYRCRPSLLENTGVNFYV